MNENDKTVKEELIKESPKIDIDTTQLQFVVYPGNHPEVVREALLRKGGLKEVNNIL